MVQAQLEQNRLTRQLLEVTRDMRDVLVRLADELELQRKLRENGHAAAVAE